MKLAQCNKRRAFGKVLHESSGRPGPTFTRGYSQTNHVVRWNMDDTADTTSGDANRYYQLEVPHNQFIDLVGGTLALMMRDTPGEEWETRVARVRQALEDLGLT